jgi:glycine/D-amino acid oxidase-like deaminating enzyme
LPGESGYDAVVVGAGIVGAACTHYLSLAGLRVAVVDRGGVAAGTTGSGEGNVLVSDKMPGPELALAVLSNRLWRELADELDESAEVELKGGLVVTEDGRAFAGLSQLAERQAEAGVQTERIPAERIPDLEPNLRSGLAGGVYYPQDLQVQPMAAAANLLRRAEGRGARLLFGREVTGIERRGARVTGLVTDREVLATAVVVNAAGPWAGLLARLAGLELPVLPRRGFILVTEPLPRVIRHKVYTADYLANVASSGWDLETSTVIEGTKSGTVLIGSSRERVGFDDTFSVRVAARIAAQATRLVPRLAGVRVLRAYHGFRPYSPDHLPIIGEDPRLVGLYHATGHEGAGIGLAPATACLLTQAVTGRQPELDLSPFRVDRFAVRPVGS